MAAAAKDFLLKSCGGLFLWKNTSKIWTGLNWLVMFSKKATKIDKVFMVDLTLFIKRQIDSEDLTNFRGLLRKYEL